MTLKKIRVFLIGASTLLILSFLGFRDLERLSPVPSAEAGATFQPKVVASIPYWDQKRAFQSFQDHAASIDFISLFWYTLDGSGRIVPYRDADRDQAIIDFAHEHGVKVFLLVANLPDEEGTSWDWRRVDGLLRNRIQRQKFISQALQFLETSKADGITLDFESLREWQRNSFSKFVQELAQSLHRKRKLLRVSVEYLADTSHTHGKDWRAITKAADQLAIMAYDQHWNESQPGPVAALPWVERTLKFARSLRLPMSKISLGVPLYGYDWGQRPDGRYAVADSLQYDETMKLRQQYGGSVSYDQRLSSPSMKYRNSGRLHVVWYENQRSFRSKFSLAKKYQVGSIFVWRLGGEDKGMWRVLGDSG